ncbi:MAG: GNAT family N-acetyltransferase [Bacteroidota bacterium]
MSPSPYKTFETERLILRPTHESDAAYILEIMNTPKWIKNIGDRKVHSEAAAIKYIQERMLPQLERLGYSNYTVIRKSDGVKMGSCGLYDREGLDGIDIGFAFLPAYEKKGYAYEASSRIMKAAIEDFGIGLIKAITIPSNTASQKLLEKLGLKFQKRFFMEGDSEELMLYQWEVESD